jgi:glycosyltransferase involved in cell wall biosynthesis
MARAPPARSVVLAGYRRPARTTFLVNDRSPAAAKIGDLAADAGIRHVHVVAWRDLADVEAGGSEIHAAHVCRAWAEAGVDVTLRTSFAQGHPPEVTRDGYRVIRRAGRYLVFPRAALAEIARRTGPRDALVEIWNGMPFFSPLWARGPRLTFLHHVHGEMWRMVLPPNLAQVGDTIERRIAPALYRRSRIATLSESSKADMVAQLGFRPDRVAVVPPGIDGRFSPGGERSPVPHLVAVGRLMPAKRFDVLIRAAAQARASVPGLRLTIVGDGYERIELERIASEVGGTDWIDLPGRCSDAELVSLYRRAWLLASASSHEGWGMSITEAAACGTPAVATDIPGHRDAIRDGVTGVLCPEPEALGPAIAQLLGDDAGRERMGAAALERSARYTWSATATELMRLLADEARASRLRRLLSHRS